MKLELNDKTIEAIVIAVFLICVAMTLSFAMFCGMILPHLRIEG